MNQKKTESGASCQDLSEAEVMSAGAPGAGAWGIPSTLAHQPQELKGQLPPA